MKYSPVSLSLFTSSYVKAFEVSKNVQDNCTPLDECDFENKILFLSDDNHSGFALSGSGELTNVFSVFKGRGHSLVQHALAHGASHLDCFEGYLTGFYEQHGFVEYKREANWNAGGSDVVFMRAL